MTEVKLICFKNKKNASALEEILLSYNISCRLQASEDGLRSEIFVPLDCEEKSRALLTRYSRNADRRKNFLPQVLMQLRQAPVTYAMLIIFILSFIATHCGLNEENGNWLFFHSFKTIRSISGNQVIKEVILPLQAQGFWPENWWRILSPALYFNNPLLFFIFLFSFIPLLRISEKTTGSIYCAVLLFISLIAGHLLENHLRGALFCGGFCLSAGFFGFVLSRQWKDIRFFERPPFAQMIVHGLLFLIPLIFGFIQKTNWGLRIPAAGMLLCFVLCGAWGLISSILLSGEKKL